MCGIAGIVGAMADEARAERVRVRQRHRGPDDEGSFSDRAVALAHTRLSVIDPTEAGHQPMRSPDGNHVLVYNGEVYNFRSVRDRLRDLGHTFGSETDSEVVLHGWAEWGPPAVELLQGMFAFAVWNSRERTLHLVRDPLGIKPLYWHHNGDGTFVFASEVRALLASGLVPCAIDREVLPAFLSQQTVPTPRTLVAGVRMLEPGSVLRVKVKEGRAGLPEVHRYWDVVGLIRERREELAVLDRGVALRGLRERLQAAVARRLVADVPLGAFLSGGVDSTAVVGLMTQATSTPVRTFTVAFEEEGYDDGPYARLASEHLTTNHTEIRLSNGDLVESVPLAVAAQDHPSADGVNTWIVSRSAREAGLTVALSGLGGDELFGGYSSFGRLRALARAQPFLRMVPRPLRSGVGRLLRRAGCGVTTDKIAAILRTDGSVPQAYPVLRQLFAPHQMSSLLEQVGTHGDETEGYDADPYSVFLGETLEGRTLPLSPLEQVSLAELTCYMRDVLLRDTDQMSMAHSLEVRVPFLDQEVVEYALALADDARKPTTPPKRYLVHALRDLLPVPVASRAKSGFTMPFDRWMRGPLRDFCEAGIGGVADHPAFRAEGVVRVWDGFLAGDRRLPWSRTWLLVALGHWLKREGIEKSV